MSSLFESCESLFGTRNLYEVLSVRPECSDSEVKRGYHKVSLRVHPDRVTNDQKVEATDKFQTLGKVYGVLSDKEKRAVYDETGEVDDENGSLDENKDWAQYWRLLFAKVTEEDILEFENKYRGSEEEVADLKQAYVDKSGDLDLIIDSIMCSNGDDESRFREILNPFIESEELPKFDAFTKDDKKKRAARKKKASKEAAEADAMKEELGFKADDSLRNMIQLRQQSRESQMNNFFSDLESKYAQPKKAKSSKSDESKKGKSKRK